MIYRGSEQNLEPAVESGHQYLPQRKDPEGREATTGESQRKIGNPYLGKVREGVCPPLATRHGGGIFLHPAPVPSGLSCNLIEELEQ